QNLKSWAKVGAAPVTRKCLESNQVRREFGDGDGEHDQVMLHIQSQNDMCTYFLTQRGFDGDQLKAKLNKKKNKRAVTKAHSIERQELLSKAKTHGALFCATGGGHITSDDFFKSMEMPVSEAEIKAMEKDKARRLALAKYEDEARMILESKEK
ncbi:hypothetical protein ACHAXS_012907, partial [Conticribra weissflogii]